MDKSIENLIYRYNHQQATADDVKEIERLLESGAIELDQLQEMQRLDHQLSLIEYPAPSPDLDVRFYDLLSRERALNKSFSWRKFFSWPELAPKLALASVMLIIGVTIGFLAKPSIGGQGEDIAAVKSELTELREMMMLSLLEKESATERLKAVSITSEFKSASEKVTSALIQTLNEDENVNVRLAALDALKPYAKDGAVRQALIRSIARQTSPLVQVALADLMAQLQAKSSVKELRKLLESENTPKEVKSRIKQSIDILI